MRALSERLSKVVAFWWAQVGQITPHTHSTHTHYTHTHYTHTRGSNTEKRAASAAKRHETETESAAKRSATRQERHETDQNGKPYLSLYRLT